MIWTREAGGHPPVPPKKLLLFAPNSSDVNGWPIKMAVRQCLAWFAEQRRKGSPHDHST